jgi:hypothetical protein
MPVESVEVENGVSGQGTFQWEEYVELFPPQVADKLTVMFQGLERGWKRRAILLQKMAEFQEKAASTQQELIESFDYAPRGRKTGYMTEINAELNAYRTLLASLSEKGLRALAEDKNVSYDSYMNSGDRDGLISAILEETVAA